MLKRYSVSNFKAIGNEVTIDIRPVTLLFGPNSSGKSSLLQSILVLGDVLRDGRLDVHRVSAPGARVDVGGLAQFVHNGSVDTGVTWRLEIDNTDDDYDDSWSRADWIERHPYVLFETKSSHQVQVKEIGSTFVVDGREERGLQLGVDVSLDGEPLFSAIAFGAYGDVGIGRSPRSMKVNYEHPTVVDYIRRKVFKGEYEFEVRSISFDVQQVTRLLLGATRPNLVIAGSRQGHSYSHKSMHMTWEWGSKAALVLLEAHQVDEELGQSAERIVTAFSTDDDWAFVVELMFMEPENRAEEPEWHEFRSRWKALGYDVTYGDLESLAEGFRRAEHWVADGWAIDVLTELHRLVQGLLNEPIGAISAQHLGPMRWAPARSEALDHVVGQARAQEEEDWRNLVNSEKARAVVNEWLGDNRLGTSLEIVEQRGFLEDEIKSALKEALRAPKRDEIEKTFNEALNARQSMGTFGQLRDKVTGRLVSLLDVGYGVSQVIPVLARAVGDHRGLQLIEQPEIHLHPALQAELADLFIQSSWWNDRTFVLETHSEHLILRLLRRIRETSRIKAPEARAFNLDKLAVYYAQPSPNGTSFLHMEVSPQGEFTTMWPNGFFAERLRELL